ncbi:uncharacterized protein LOC132272598 [Cornus florida]|uniref:uncharacterized protein LOC132272598 n=1 Tax=Cornus florida TaxID=4283 RepID=UPI00289F6A5D|nr:uncharacterized protein LOC132272598 [Cornus florida]
MIMRGELANYLTTKEYVKPREVNHRKVEGNQVKVINAIHGDRRMIKSQRRSVNIGFGNGDLSSVQLPHEDSLVISLLVENCMIKRVLIDLGSRANIITKAVFEQLKIPSSSIRPTSSPLMGFDSTKVEPLQVINLFMTAAKRTLKENFILMEIHPSYNLIMGRGWIHRMNGVPSTLHQVMRCLSLDGKEVIDLRGDQFTAKEYYMLAQNEAKKDDEKTDFITKKGINCYRVMPLDSRMLGQLTSALLTRSSTRKTVEAYIDNIVVKSVKKEEHPKHLQEVFDTLRRYGMKLNPSNCSFAVFSRQFLGHIVNKRGIEVSPAQAQALIQKQELKTHREIQQAALNQLKCYMAEPLILSAPKPGETPIMYLAISSIATSAVLIRKKVSHKGHALTDFLLEHEDKPEEPGPSEPQWELQVDGSSNLIRVGAGNVIITPEGTKLQQSIRLTFPATNNEAKYEALLTGFQLANQLQVRCLKVFSDSQLVVNQVIGQYQTKEDRMKAYREAMESASRGFDQIEFHQVLREENSEVDQLAAATSSSDEDLV